jgi:hypothetical protein
MMKTTGYNQRLSRRAISRRSLLRGVGVGLALPLLNILAKIP